MSNDILVNDGLYRTDLYCHSCDKNFIAKIDCSLDGNHALECPRCGHLHYRKIVAGKVTDDRYDSDSTTHVVERRNMWKSETQPMQTSSYSAFLRDRWLNQADT